MIKNYFNINYEFDIPTVHQAIAEQVAKQEPDYICVADGVILNTANRKPEYLKVINGGMFAICDSGFVPLYIKKIYGIQYDQYCGSSIFKDIIEQKKYRMCFLGTQQNILDQLKVNLSKMWSDVNDMMFYELPFCDVEGFDYKAIAEMIEKDGADIIWVALGAPKQEYFMARLKPYLKKGVMIAVGAAFKFYSGVSEKRAPKWMLDHHLEFAYRIYHDPKKQLKRCGWIVATLPKLLFEEWRRSKKQ